MTLPFPAENAINTAEAAELLARLTSMPAPQSMRRIQQLCAGGDLRCVKDSSSNWVIDAASVNELVAANPNRFRRKAAQPRQLPAPSPAPGASEPIADVWREWYRAQAEEKAIEVFTERIKGFEARIKDLEDRLDAMTDERDALAEELEMVYSRSAWVAARRRSRSVMPQRPE